MYAGAVTVVLPRVCEEERMSPTSETKMGGETGGQGDVTCPKLLLDTTQPAPQSIA